MYCLPILYTSLYSRDKKETRKIFKDTEKLDLDDIDNLDTLVSKRTKNLMLQLVAYMIMRILFMILKYPSGRYWHIKYRTSWGKDFFKTYLYNFIFKHIFYFPNYHSAYQDPFMYVQSWQKPFLATLVVSYRIQSINQWSAQLVFRTSDSGKHGMTEPSAELFSKTSEMVPNGLNIPMYES